MSILKISNEFYTSHRKLATQLEALYSEIGRLATKKPTDRITPLISRKINHIIVKVREQVTDDEFLDAIETVPVEGEQIRLDEALIILGELRAILDKQWHSEDFEAYREFHSDYESQVMK